MTTTTSERLISADDHVDLGHDRVKAHLEPKFHDAYDAGLARFGATMASTASIAANAQWREQEGLEPDPTVSMGGTVVGGYLDNEEAACHKPPGNSKLWVMVSPSRQASWRCRTGRRSTGASRRGRLFSSPWV